MREHFPKGPDVQFEEEECCALRGAFVNNESVFEKVGEFFGFDIARQAREMVNNSKRLGFPHHSAAEGVYLFMAQREQERLKNRDAGDILGCGHTIGEHRNALESLVGALSSREQ